jgi:hypothetical protein
MMQDIDDVIDEFAFEMDFDVLIAWADLLGVDHDEDTWIDDTWVDSEVSLREEVAEIMKDVGHKPQDERK